MFASKLYKLYSMLERKKQELDELKNGTGSKEPGRISILEIEIKAIENEIAKVGNHINRYEL